MRTDARSLAFIAAGLAAGAVTAAGAGAWCWNRATKRALKRLTESAGTVEALVFSAEQLAGLPAPVARYFRFALSPGQPLILGARATQSGAFRTSATASWRPFTAVQHYTTTPPGFIWDARIRMAPLLTVLVRDSYLAGTASMRASVAALLRLADAHGERELAEGALHRYLAEAVWFPTALLPGQGVTWSAVDDTSALATLADRGITVSLEFRFGTRGEIVSAFAAGRSRKTSAGYVRTPWMCEYADYAPHDGMWLPRGGKVSWLLPEATWTYWDGCFQNLDYTLVPPATR